MLTVLLGAVIAKALVTLGFAGYVLYDLIVNKL